MTTDGFSDLARGLGAQALAEVRALLSDVWDEIEGVDRAAIQEVANDLAELTLLAISGIPVEREVLHCRAAIANWAFVHAERARSAMADAFTRAVQWGGQVALKVFLSS